MAHSPLALERPTRSGPLETLYSRYPAIFDVLVFTISQKLGTIFLVVKLAFRTQTIRKLCERQASAEDRLGIDVAGYLRARVADLESAETLEDLIAGSPKTLENGVIQVNMGPTARMLIKSNHNTTPQLENGELDLSKVKRIQIIGLEADGA